MTPKKSPTPRRKSPRKAPAREPARRKKTPKPAGKEGAPSADAEKGAENPGEARPPSDIPFDAAYFERQFPNLLPGASKEAEGSATPRPFVVTVVLGDGMTQLDVQHIEQLDEQWMLIAVLDHDAYRIRPSGSSRRFVFVPYAAIARVEVTGIEGRVDPSGVHRHVPAESVSRKAGRKKKAAKKKAAAKGRRRGKATKKAAPKRKAAAGKRKRSG
ncbi:MAG: hypothetical protein ACF8XB_12480 [Planctomycetota bacterium JB042]